MADISQVKLPDGTTYNLKDSYVRTNYRALNNNDFDTINVTELNAGDVVVTGVGRFTNGLYGNLTGNADTATTASKLSGFTNTTTTGTAIDSATQNGHVYVTGTSGIYSQNDGACFVQAYSTSWVTQIYQDYRTGQIALRGKNSGTWQAWRKVWDSVNLTSKTAAASGTDLSLVTTGEKATWNAKASQDTKNTAGSTDTSSKIFLIGATSQAANPQTYSHDTAYVGTDGCLYSGGTKVLTAHQDISGKVSKSGDTMSGALTVEASNSYSSYNEGIRINAGARTYATLLMGGTNGTTSGTNDGAFWIGVYNTGTTARRLMIAHNGSTNTGTYFYASSSSDISPSLRVGSNLQVANVISANVSNSGTAGGISLYATEPTSYGIAMRGTGNGGKHGAVQGDWAIYSYMNGYNTARGWIWRNSYSNNTNIASLDVYGNAVFNGYVGIGGNETNTSGVRQVYNSTTKSLDFVFVA